MKKLIAFVLLVVFIAAPAFAVENDIMSVESAQPKIALIGVVKSERKMYLLDPDDNIIKTYRIALGPAPVGDKEREGDGKTPEGVYKIDTRNERSEFYRSLKISYPAPSDVQHARQLGVDPGGQIFIHGEPLDRNWKFWKYNNRRDWTRGCIGVTNRDIDEIWNLVADGTPIVIKP